MTDVETLAAGDLRAFKAAAAQAERACHKRVECTGVVRKNEAMLAARFRLENGLSIVLMPDARAPIFVYQTWFKVGSKNEDPNHTGLAHLFEHLMFKGTHKYPTGVFDREMEKRGTQTNAGTFFDWTYYTQALAARMDNLGTVIAFESDRMTGLVLNETTFKTELEVVKNERRMSVDDSIIGEMNEILFANAYKIHPYRWPIIGNINHLETATIPDLERFYRTFYAPNNAVIVVAGNLEPTDTLIELATAYAHIPAQKLPEFTKVVEPQQQQPQKLKLSRPLVAPQVVLGFRGPAQNDPDFAAFEMLNEILTTGDNARLYRRLVTEEQLAADVGGALLPLSEPGLYEIVITGRPETDVEQILAVTQDELLKLTSTITNSELRKAKNGLELSILDELKDVEGCAEALGMFETNYARFDLAFEGPSRWKTHSISDLARVAQKYFRPDNCTAVLAVPNGGVVCPN